MRQTFHYSDLLNFQQTEEQFGITQIPDAIRIQCNFDGLPVIDPITVSEYTSLGLSHVYPTKLQLSTLSEQIFIIICQQLKRPNMLLPLYIPGRNTSFSTTLSLLVANGFLQLEYLILQLWLGGGHLKQMV